jgi:hypothetical protein
MDPQQVSLTYLMRDHVKSAPCHHSMVHPQVANGEGLQIWKVHTNILNKQSLTANKEWYSSIAVGQGLTTPHHKNQHVMKCYTGPWTWTDSGMTCTGFILLWIGTSGGLM